MNVDEHFHIPQKIAPSIQVSFIIKFIYLKDQIQIFEQFMDYRLIEDL